MRAFIFIRPFFMNGLESMRRPQKQDAPAAHAWQSDVETVHRLIEVPMGDYSRKKTKRQSKNPTPAPPVFLDE
jgi:hypothetical protein